MISQIKISKPILKVDVRIESYLHAKGGNFIEGKSGPKTICALRYKKLVKKILYRAYNGVVPVLLTFIRSTGDF